MKSSWPLKPYSSNIATRKLSSMPISNKQAGTRILTDRRKALNLGHKVAEDFLYGEVRVVYATDAFGMDIDIPDTAAW